METTINTDLHQIATLAKEVRQNQKEYFKLRKTNQYSLDALNLSKQSEKKLDAAIESYFNPQKRLF